MALVLSFDLRRQVEWLRRSLHLLLRKLVETLTRGRRRQEVLVVQLVVMITRIQLLLLLLFLAFFFLGELVRTDHIGSRLRATIQVLTVLLGLNSALLRLLRSLTVSFAS